jgi:hypothetical protein
MNVFSKHAGPATRAEHLTSEQQWREFEIERWRSALRQRGLKLKSIDPEYQRALFEATLRALGRRRLLLITRPRLAIRLHTVRRLVTMASLLAIGYGATFLASAPSSWAHDAVVAVIRETCMTAYSDTPPSDQDPAYSSKCATMSAY